MADTWKVEPGHDAEYYLNHIAAYEREFEPWYARAKKIVERYRDDKRKSGSGARFNVLWSNVQTLKAATFARMPMPDVSRRFKDNDPVGRVAALLLERALEFEVNHYRDFGASIRQCVYDRFLGGRGTAWVRYQPTFKQVQAGELEDGPLVTEDVDAETQVAEELDYECAPVDYVHWRDFGHAVARTWEEVPMVWRKVYMGRAELVERFGESAKTIPMDAQPEELNKARGSTDTDGLLKRALIYEIWDKDTGQALWMSRTQKDFVDCRDDPLGLEEFFPCPPPLYATLTTDNLIPLPDYTLYQDQAIELDTLSDRIDGLIKALQLKGVYDATIPELARLFTEGTNGDLIPVKNWAAFAEKQGLKGGIDIVEILPIAQALAEAYKAFEQVKNQIYELTGISDILRGETMASETATAQKIKNSYASMRLKTYQDEVERFAARLFQLKAQIICMHFDPMTIAELGAADQLSDEDKQVVPMALQMLKDSKSRHFRIDVETDSMVFQDEQQDKADRMEFLGAVSGFLEKSAQAAQAAPQMVPLAIEMLKFGVRGFRIGKSLEGTIDQFADQMKQQMAQQQANPQPHPDAMKAQADMQKTQMQVQADQQTEQMRVQADQQKMQAQLQADQQSEAMRAQHEAALAQMKAQADAEQKERDRQHQASLEQMKAQFADQQDQRTEEFNRWKALLDNETKVTVAQLAAETSLKTSAMSASDDSKEVSPDGTSKPTSGLSALVEAVNEQMAALVEGQQASHKALVEVLTKPKKVVRDGSGAIIGVQ